MLIMRDVSVMNSGSIPNVGLKSIQIKVSFELLKNFLIAWKHANNSMKDRSFWGLRNQLPFPRLDLNGCLCNYWDNSQDSAYSCKLVAGSDGVVALSSSSYSKWASGIAFTITEIEMMVALHEKGSFTLGVFEYLKMNEKTVHLYHIGKVNLLFSCIEDVGLYLFHGKEVKFQRSVLLGDLDDPEYNGYEHQYASEKILPKSNGCWSEYKSCSGTLSSTAATPIT